MEFDVLSIVQMIGGLALFIYGMTTMGKGLERAAGSKLEKTLEKMTGNVFTALIMGMVVTMVIQSSSATTVMVVGFVVDCFLCILHLAGWWDEAARANLT